MTKHTFDYDHLCDLLHAILPAELKTEMERLNLPEKKLRSLLKRYARDQRQRIAEIEIEVHDLLEDKDDAAERLQAVIEMLPPYDS